MWLVQIGDIVIVENASERIEQQRVALAGPRLALAGRSVGG
ncbi:hypothetical protein [Nocardia uniformis]|nr:hypothetical protein [Nocardia uniformis]